MTRVSPAFVTNQFRLTKQANGISPERRQVTGLQVLRLLRDSVGRGDHDGLATAALAKHCNVLL